MLPPMQGAATRTTQTNRPALQPAGPFEAHQALEQIREMMRALADMHQAFLKEAADVKMNVGRIAEGKPGRPGNPGAPGRPGTSIDHHAVVRDVLNQIPKPKNGRPGKDGEPGLHADPMAVIEEIQRAKHLKPEHIAGLMELINALRAQMQSNSNGWKMRGGGDTVVAGSGIVIVRNPNGQSVISRTGTGTGYQVPLTGGLTGINTWASAPDVLIIDGVPRQKVQTDGTIMWTLSGLTTTLVNAPLPTFDIFAAN